MSAVAAAGSGLEQECRRPCRLVCSKSIERASLLQPKPYFQRLYILPFLMMYLSIASGIAVFAWQIGFTAAWERGFELIAGILSLTVFFNILTFLGTFWDVRFRAFVSFSKCSLPSEDSCNIMIVPAKHKGKSEIVPLLRDANNNLHFLFQQNKFVWNPSSGSFEKASFPVSLKFSEYIQQTEGSGLDNFSELLELYGKNTFNIPHPSFVELFQEHAVAPFFLFQVFCVGLWLLDEYWYYSLFTLVMLVVFECTVVQQRLTNMKEFKTMSIKAYDVSCKRSGQWITCNSDEILPGDIVQLSLQDGNETVIPCDMLLIEGSCIVNEAMLSGESTPLQKESIRDREPEECLSISEDRVHILFAGTKLLQVNSAQNSNHATCYVLKTGFHTTQGKLVRTMIYNSENVTANNLESFLFILFLLMFALVASGYVWMEGMKDPSRSRFKLILECIIIITQVIPPELPMELSLAVNASLMALTQFAIFCTEPFRIPFAGKVDVCCLDKTGTITEENLVVKGIAGTLPTDPSALIDCPSAPRETLIALGACHSLAVVDNKCVGDPMEIAAFQCSPWNLSQADTIICKTSSQRIRILKKFHFSSALKRMSTVCSVSEGSHEKHFVTVKGAPEVLHSMFDDAPAWYSQVYKKFAKQGCRVISLGIKQLPKLNSSLLHSYLRDDAEQGLKFCGFLVFHCPLKRDSLDAIKALNQSSHKVIMITGDNALTSIHVAGCVGILQNESNCLLIDTLEEDETVLLISNINDDITRVVTLEELKVIIPEFKDICITGTAYNLIASCAFFSQLLSKICVFARASPTQKEAIILAYKEHKLVTLMCGDGTNDVGALKQAHIGVALLDGKPEDLEKIKRRMQLEAFKKQQENIAAFQRKLATKLGQPASEDNKAQERMLALNNALNDGELPSVKLGDASVAAPFTSKISTLDSICTIIKQGRCTLVTTLQMYKILALNSLISAYSLSVLHLEGIRYADIQSTIMGFLITFCFLFLSKAKPLSKLSSSRPQANIFNRYVMSSLMGQFAVHLVSLFIVNRIATVDSEPVKSDSGFVPSLKNSMVYLMSLSMQVCTFMINYQGHPFRESLLENKPLRNCLFGVGAVGFLLALEVFPDINEYLQIVKFTSDIKIKMISLMIFNYGFCAVIEKTAEKLFANPKSKSFFHSFSCQSSLKALKQD